MIDFDAAISKMSQFQRNVLERRFNRIFEGLTRPGFSNLKDFIPEFEQYTTNGVVTNYSGFIGKWIELTKQFMREANKSFSKDDKYLFEVSTLTDKSDIDVVYKALSNAFNADMRAVGLNLTEDRVAKLSNLYKQTDKYVSDQLTGEELSAIYKQFMSDPSSISSFVSQEFRGVRGGESREARWVANFLSGMSKSNATITAGLLREGLIDLSDIAKLWRNRPLKGAIPDIFGAGYNNSHHEADKAVIDELRIYLSAERMKKIDDYFKAVTTGSFVEVEEVDIVSSQTLDKMRADVKNSEAARRDALAEVQKLKEKNKKATRFIQEQQRRIRELEAQSLRALEDRLKSIEEAKRVAEENADIIISSMPSRSEDTKRAVARILTDLEAERRGIISEINKLRRGR